MEDNSAIQVSAQIESGEKVKKCECCGKYYPYSAFDRAGKGYRNICRSCVTKQKNGGENPKFMNFTSRELIQELIARGYKGKLTLVRTEEFVL